MGRQARAAGLVHLVVGGIALVVCGIAADVYRKGALPGKRLVSSLGTVVSFLLLLSVVQPPGVQTDAAVASRYLRAFAGIF